MALISRQNALLSEDEIERVAQRLRRIFIGSCGLTVLAISLLLLAAPRWAQIEGGLRAGLTAILLWSVAVTAYGFYSQTCVAAMMKEMLRQKSFIDEVTGVFNYRYLDLRLAEEAERTRRQGGLTALLYLDLDNFKRVNDRFGHPVGNVVLNQLATLMSQRVRLTDVFGRIGGDEFLVVMPQTDRREAFVLGERLRDFVEGYTLEVGENQRIDFIRLSVGVAAFPVNGETIENVITAADNAVYEAKAQGGSFVAMAGEFISSDELGHQLVRSAEGDAAPSKPDA